MPAANAWKSPARREHRVIVLVWRVAVVLTLLVQVFIAALRTPWGERAVPDLLIRAGFLRAAQKEQLVTFLYPPGFNRVASLTQQIRLGLPANEPIEIVYSDAALMTSIEDLRYQLYPRVISERPMARFDDASPSGCRIYWQLERDVRIACAAWNNGSASGPPAAGSQP